MVRAVSYNIHSRVGGDRRGRAERILHVLREAEADIVALHRTRQRNLIDT